MIEERIIHVCNLEGLQANDNSDDVVRIREPMQMPRVTYNKGADAAYIYLREDAQIARTRNLDGVRLIDYAEDSEPVGIELLDVSEGVNLDDLPARDVIASLLEQQHSRVFA